MSHFASTNYRSILTRRDAINVGGLGLLGYRRRNLFPFLSASNPISKVFA